MAEIIPPGAAAKDDPVAQTPRTTGRTRISAMLNRRVKNPSRRHLNPYQQP